MYTSGAYNSIVQHANNGNSELYISIQFIFCFKGENDAFLDVSLAEGHEAVCSDVTVRSV